MSVKSRGSDFERRVKRHLESAGWVVVRAAGSLGPADLVAMQSVDGALGGSTVRLMGVKLARNRMGPKERDILARSAWYAGATPWLASRGPKPRCAILIEPLPTLGQTLARLEGKS